MNAIILFSYANLHSIDDIEPFYHHIFHGNVKEDSVARGRHMYESVGTCDPLASNTRRIGEALVRRLKESTGEQWTFYIGNKHIAPFISDAVQACLKDGAKRIVTLGLTPFASRTGTEVYERKVVQVLDNQGYSHIPVKHISPFFNDEMVIDVLSSRLNDAINWLPECVRDQAEVIFTAHSMPGRPEAHQVFIDQYTILAQRLIETTEMSSYHLAYRSQGAHPQIWLEPNVLDVIKQIGENNGQAVVICELLSVIANAEAISELGEDSKHLANQLGMDFVQTEYLNDSDDFMQALFQHVFHEVTRDKRAL